MSDSIPRLSIEQMTPELSAFLAPRVARLGYLGEFFQCTALQPAALLSFLEFTEHLKHALPADLTEIVVLSAAEMMSNAYERVQHERLCLKLGFSHEWIRAVLSLEASSEQLSGSQKLVQKLAIAVVQRGGRNTTAELDLVVSEIGAEQAIAVLMLVGRYVSHAMIVNCLDLLPPAKALALLAQNL